MNRIYLTKNHKSPIFQKLFIFAIFAIGLLPRILAQNCAVNAGSPQTLCAPLSEMTLYGATSGFNVDLSTINWSIISQPSGANVTITNPGSLTTTVTGIINSGNYVFRVSATCTVGTTFQDVTYTINAAPTQASIPATQAAGCYTGGSILLSAGNTAGSGETVSWKVPSSNGHIASGSNTTNSAHLIPSFSQRDCRNANQYYVNVEYTISNGVCTTTDEMSVSMTYVTGPIYVTAIPDERCGRTTDLYASCSVDGSGTWSLDYTNAPGGTATFLDSTNPFTKVTVSDTGLFSFKWTITGATCRNGFASDTAYFYDCLGTCVDFVDEEAGDKMYFCDLPSSVSLNADHSPVGFVGVWTQIDGYPITISDINDPNATLTGLQTGQGPWYFTWELTGPACVWYDTVAIFERSAPAMLETVDVCLPESWPFAFQFSEDFVVDNVDSINLTLTLASAPEDYKAFRTVFYNYSTFEGPSCIIGACATNIYFNRADQYWTTNAVLIKHDTLFNLGQSMSFIWGKKSTQFIFNQNVNGERHFLNSSGLGMYMFDFTPGRYVFEYQYFDGCETKTGEIEMNLHKSFINQSANAGTDLVLSCGTDSAQLAGNDLEPTSSVWSYISGPGPNPLDTSTMYDQYVTVRNLNDGVHMFRYTENGGYNCAESEDTMMIHISSAGPAGVIAIADDDTTCDGGSIKLFGNTGTGASGTWSIVSGSTSSVTFYPNDTTNNVTVSGLSGTANYTFRFTVANNCGNSFDEVDVHVNSSTGGDPAIITDDVFCTSSSAFSGISAQAVTTGSLTWSVLQGAGSISNPSTNPTTVTGLTLGSSNLIELSVSNTGCSYISKDTVIINYNFNPNVTILGESQQAYCNVDLPYTLSLDGDIGSYQSGFNRFDLEWEQNYGPAAVTFTQKDSIRTDVTFDSAGVYNLRFLVNQYGCAATEYADVTIVIAGEIWPAFAGLDDTLCGGSGLFTLDAFDIQPGNGSGYWAITETQGSSSAFVIDDTDPNTQVQLTGIGSTTLSWTTISSIKGCKGNTDEVTLHYTSPVDAGEDLLICDKTSTNLQGSLSSTVGAGGWTQVLGPVSSITDPSQSFTQVTGLSSGNTFQYQYSISYLGCTQKDTVEVVSSGVTGTPADSSVAVQCIGASYKTIVLYGTTPSSGVTTSWSLIGFPAGYSNGTLTTTSTNGALFTATTMPEGNYVFLYSWLEGNCEKSAVVSIETESCVQFGDFVWEDTNKDGLQDVGEPGLSGITIYLYDGSGTLLDSSVTNLTGQYGFLDLAAGTYKVGLNNIPLGYNVSLANVGANDTIDSDLNAVTLISGSYSISNADILTADIGLSPLPTIGDYVWLDINKDGVQGAEEPGVSGVTVSLYDSSSNVISVTQTDAYGKYFFNTIEAGNYQVGFNLPTNYEFTSQNTGSANQSDANATTGLTSIFTINTIDNLDLDAGLILSEPNKICVGDKIFLDSDNDGIQDTGEEGVAGVTLTLYDNSSNIVNTAITDQNGIYHFCDITAGTYTIGLTPLAGLVSSMKDAGVDDETDSDFDPNTFKTGPFTVSVGDNLTNLDGGLYPQENKKASLGDRVWYDINKNGQQDVGEPGVSGTTVILKDGSGTSIDSTTTDELGHYIFNSLTPDDYTISVKDIPVDYEFVFKYYGFDNTIDSDVNDTTGISDTITLESSEINMTIDAGVWTNILTNTATLGDKVWLDVDKDGIQDSDEIGIAGIAVILYNNIGVEIDRTITDKNGNYLFINLPAGSYSIEFTNLLEGYVFSPTGSGTSSTDNDANSIGKTSSITLVAGENKIDIDAGVYNADLHGATASLGDKVWYDLNNNGIQDSGEPGVGGIIVQLIDPDGTTVLSSTTTNALGSYIFTGLDAGEYYIKFITNTFPTGYSVVAQNAGSNDGLDSDPNTTTGLTTLYTLVEGEDNLSIDAGIHKPGVASLGNYVWNDLDKDGIQDGVEPGVSGISVNLYDDLDSLVGSTTTDAKGFYLFTNLVADDYYVVFASLPNGYQFTTQTTGNIDGSDANNAGATPTIVLASGVTNLDIDAGIYSNTTASLAGRLWFDEDNDGVEDNNELPISGALIELLDSNGVVVSVAITDQNGGYLFANLTPGDFSVRFNKPTSTSFFTIQTEGTSNGSDPIQSTGTTGTITVAAGSHTPNIDGGIITPQPTSLGNYIWIDADNDGIQDGNHEGVAGVIVELYNSNDNLISTTVTSSDGSYLFANLQPGDYYVIFNLGTLPTDYSVVSSNQGADDNLDSDANNTTGKTGTYTLISGENNLSVDMGIYSTNVRIGGIVWADANANGLQNGVEGRVAGTVITLYDNSGNVVTCANAGGNLADSFGSANYGNNDGSVSFSNSWVETGENDGPTAGAIYTTPAKITIEAANSRSITRTFDLTAAGASSPVTLIFDWAVDKDGGGSMSASYEYNNGTTWVSVVSVTDDSSGSFNGTIPINSTGIRFVYDGNSKGTWATLDNLNISWPGTTDTVKTVTNEQGEYEFSTANWNCLSGGTTYQVRIENTDSTVNGHTISPQNASGNSNNDPSTDILDSDGSTGTASGYNTITVTYPTSGENMNLDFGYNITNPLPVELFELSGMWLNKDGYLQWSTGSEVNNSHFELQRSLDGVNFEFIDIIESKSISGNSSQTIQYNFTDYNVKSIVTDQVYYKLFQIDFDGSRRFEGMVLLSNQKSADVTILAWPVPTTNIVNISVQNLKAKQGLVMELYSMDGRVVYSSVIENPATSPKFTIDMSNLGAGIYKARFYNDRISKVISLEKL